jgi:hypothetical protein
MTSGEVVKDFRVANSSSTAPAIFGAALSGYGAMELTLISQRT